MAPILVRGLCPGGHDAVATTTSIEVTQVMRLAMSVLLYGILGVLGCTHVDSQQTSNDRVASTATDVAAHSTLDPRIGKWISKEQTPLGVVLILKADGHFCLGNFQNGTEYPGLTGKWMAQDKDVLCLKVETSESCKISEGSELSFLATLQKDGREMAAMERTFVRVVD